MPAGYLSTKIGGSRVLWAGVLLWSLGTLIAPPAAKMSLVALCATRVIVSGGVGRGGEATVSVLTGD